MGVRPSKANNLQLMMNTPLLMTMNGADFPTPMWKRRSKSSLVSLQPKLLELPSTNYAVLDLIEIIVKN
jgi:hypothetical protein